MRLLLDTFPIHVPCVARGVCWEECTDRRREECRHTSKANTYVASLQRLYMYMYGTHTWSTQCVIYVSQQDHTNSPDITSSGSNVYTPMLLSLDWCTQSLGQSRVQQRQRVSKLPQLAYTFTHQPKPPSSDVVYMLPITCVGRSNYIWDEWSSFTDTRTRTSALQAVCVFEYLLHSHT